MATQQTPNLPAVAQPHAIIAAGETSSSAVAAQARASVESRYLVALHRPRSWDDMRVKLLEACRRPGFAESAMYSKPVGGKPIVGPSIRFVEEALRCTKNVLTESPILYDDDEKRLVRVMITDLEANITYLQDIVIAKTVERRSLKAGQTAIRSRQNSYGQTVHLVEATEDDLLVKQAALVSKAIRTQGLRLIPGDIVEEAVGQITATVQNQDAKDPDAAKKRLIDLFYAHGVAPSDLEKYLGHPIAQTSPAELQQLRLVYQAIKEGESTFAQALEQRDGARENGAPVDTKPQGKGTEALRSSLKKQQPAAPQPAAAPVVASDDDEDLLAEDRKLARDEGSR